MFVASRSVLNNGYIQLVSIMGDDYRILESARISTGANPVKGDEKDQGLIRYLYKNKHLSPFEQVVTTWRVNLPIFVARQWMRHRTQSFNEKSARYTELPKQFYIPEEFRLQSTTNKQGSGKDIVEGKEKEELYHTYIDSMDDIYLSYDELLQAGVAKEMARFVLPMAQYTEFYTTVNLRNLFQFLTLRLHSHAQLEIRLYAEAMLDILKSLSYLKWSVSAFEEFRELDELFSDVINLSKTDTSFIKNILIEYKSELEDQ